MFLYCGRKKEPHRFWQPVCCHPSLAHFQTMRRPHPASRYAVTRSGSAVKLFASPRSSRTNIPKERERESVRSKSAPCCVSSIPQPESIRSTQVFWFIFSKQKVLVERACLITSNEFLSTIHRLRMRQPKQRRKEVLHAHRHVRFWRCLIIRACVELVSCAPLNFRRQKNYVGRMSCHIMRSECTAMCFQPFPAGLCSIPSFLSVCLQRVFRFNSALVVFVQNSHRAESVELVFFIPRIISFYPLGPSPRPPSLG